MKSNIVPLISDVVVPSPEETTVNNFLCILPNIFYTYTTYLSLSFFISSHMRVYHIHSPSFTLAIFT